MLSLSQQDYSIVCIRIVNTDSFGEIYCPVGGQAGLRRGRPVLLKMMRRTFPILRRSQEQCGACMEAGEQFRSQKGNCSLMSDELSEESAGLDMLKWVTSFIPACFTYQGRLREILKKKVIPAKGQRRMRPRS
jgi:hypothetical protein